MSMPFYVSPEQLMKDRADFARKGIARGRSVAVVEYAGGILFVSENPSQALHKISEIYDRIAFAAVGRYNEFENLRIGGVRLADTRGYAYDRRDVTGRGLANAYAQTLGTIFSSGGEKPYEVEIFVAELGTSADGDQIFRLTYDGQVADEHDYAAMGGQAESVTTYLAEHWHAGLPLDEAIRLAVAALGHGESGDRRIPADDLEAAVLDRDRPLPRKFRRLPERVLRDILGADPEPDQGPDPSTPPVSPEPGSAPDSDAGAEPDSEPDARPDSGPDTEPDTGPDTQPDGMTEPAADPSETTGDETIAEDDEPGPTPITPDPTPAEPAPADPQDPVVPDDAQFPPVAPPLPPRDDRPPLGGEPGV